MCTTEPGGPGPKRKHFVLINLAPRTASPVLWRKDWIVFSPRIEHRPITLDRRMLHPKMASLLGKFGKQHSKNLTKIRQ